MIPQIEKIKQLRTLFKYVSDSPSVIDGIFNKKKIRFTQPAALNDPLEFNPTIRFNSEDGNFKKFSFNEVNFPSIHDWYRLNVIESKINNFGIVSLTDNPFSFEMWCQYSNGHKGILIEFDIPDKTKPMVEMSDGQQLKAHKVRYVKNYNINIDKLEKGNNSIPFYRMRDAIFLRKTNHWKHEREYRIIRPLMGCDNFKKPKKRTSYRDDNNIYLFPISLKCINSVIFGVNTPIETKSKIIESCKNNKIDFLQTIIKKDQGNKLEFVSLKEFGSINEFLSMAPQIFTFDSIATKFTDKILVNSINEIPYYKIQPKDYDEYYQKQLSKKQKKK